MLKKSFIHIKGISKEKERELWNSGVNSWEDLLSIDVNSLPFSLKENVREDVVSSLSHFTKKNFEYFSERIPRNQHWRMYSQLKGKCCFLDIETSGLNKQHDVITIIGVYDGKESKIFVEGKNMKDFPKEIAKYDMVVTFNGACFDLPFIRSKHQDVLIPKFHVDLRYALRNLGYTGGLKKIEKEFGINRGKDIEDVDGFEAIRLWKAYKKGDNNALKKLIDYNVADIQNLKPLMEYAFDNLCKGCN